MSKEILYKAKRLDNGLWIEGDYSRLILGGNLHHYITPLDEKKVEIDSDTICEFVKSANGEKFFVNDEVVISTDSHGKLGHAKGEWKTRLMFDSLDCCYKFQCIEDGKKNLFWGFNSQDFNGQFYKKKVVGNIHH